VLEKALLDVEGVDNQIVGQIIALGMVNVLDLEEVGPEPLTKELEMERPLAEKIVARCVEEARRVAEAQARRAAEAETEAASTDKEEAEAPSEPPPAEPEQPQSDQPQTQESDQQGDLTEQAPATQALETAYPPADTQSEPAEAVVDSQDPSEAQGSPESPDHERNDEPTT